jgi:hypothetical protein
MELDLYTLFFMEWSMTLLPSLPAFLREYGGTDE